MKIAFLQTAHAAHDERVWENQRASLVAAGDTVEVLSTMGNNRPADKCRTIRHFLQHSLPEIVICDTPFAVVEARLCSHATVVWDVTEWYPSKKDLRASGLAYHVLKFIKKLFFRLAKRMAHAFIFGETDKQAPFLPTRKPNLMLPYYPRLEYVDFQPEPPLVEPCLLYAGPLTEDKGWPDVLKAFRLLQQEIPGIRLDVITAQSNDAPSYPGIRYLPPMPFADFCNALSRYHVMLDLRRIDEENTRCLPIKIFYYMAAGRPVVYSQLGAIRKGIPEIDECARLVQPDDVQSVAAAVRNYLEDSALYHKHAARARQLALEKYNWQQLETSFTQFIHAL